MLGVFKYIATLAGELREKGVFNMLLSDGRYVMAFCSTNLHWITRRAPFGVAKLLDGCGDRLSTRDHTQRCGHGYRHAAADGQ